MTLTLTDSAVRAVEQLVASRPSADGIRIAASADAASNPYSLSVVDEPEKDDEIVEEQGVRVFLETGVADDLGDKALDARVESSQVSFFVVEQ